MVASGFAFPFVVTIHFGVSGAIGLRVWLLYVLVLIPFHSGAVHISRNDDG